MLMLHVDQFKSEITKKGRSKIIEEYDPNSKITQVDEALIILVSIEKQDEPNPWNISKKSSDE
jgi:threonyl-tRNA synthetase